MNIGQSLPTEKHTRRDPETGRAVMLWTQGAADDIGLYYHQNAFDARRGFVYFVSNRTGSFQIWRVDRRNGRQTQVRMKCSVCEVGIADLAKSAIAPPACWCKTAGESHIQIQLNIAPGVCGIPMNLMEMARL